MNEVIHPHPEKTLQVPIFKRWQGITRKGAQNNDYVDR